MQPHSPTLSTDYGYCIHNVCVTRFVIKESYTCTVSRHTFHCHLLATSMDQQGMCLVLLKGEQSAFAQASFSSLPDIHDCSGGLQMAPSFLDKESAD